MACSVFDCLILSFVMAVGINTAVAIDRIYWNKTFMTVPENIGQVTLCIMAEFKLRILVKGRLFTTNPNRNAANTYVDNFNQTFKVRRGQSPKCINATVLDDDIVDLGKVYFINITVNSDVFVANESQTMQINITNDDTATAQFEEKYSREVEENFEEGKIELVCVINGTSSIPLHIGFVIDNFTSTAIEGSDFTLQNKTLTFPPGTNRKTLTINIKRDGLPESTEILLVKMVSLDDRFVVIGRNDTAKIKIHDKFDQENDKARQEREAEKQHQIFILMVVAAVFVAILCVISIVLCICLIKFVKKMKG